MNLFSATGKQAGGQDPFPLDTGFGDVESDPSQRKRTPITEKHTTHHDDCVPGLFGKKKIADVPEQYEVTKPQAEITLVAHESNEKPSPAVMRFYEQLELLTQLGAEAEVWAEFLAAARELNPNDLSFIENQWDKNPESPQRKQLREVIKNCSWENFLQLVEVASTLVVDALSDKNQDIWNIQLENFANLQGSLKFSDLFSAASSYLEINGVTTKRAFVDGQIEYVNSEGTPVSFGSQGNVGIKPTQPSPTQEADFAKVVSPTLAQEKTNHQNRQRESQLKIG